ncbi:MAG: PHP domain-containing protein, partial [Paraclostridium sp.]
MESIKEYLDRLEINNNMLIKQLEDVNISKVTYFKEEKLIYIYLSSKNIISYENLESLRLELKEKFNYFNDVKVKIRYIKLEKHKTKDIVKKYWGNIIYILKYICPSISGWVKSIEHMCIDETLKIKIPDELFYTRLMKQNAIQVLKNVFNEELGLDIEIVFEKSANRRTDVSKIIKKTDADIEEIVKERMSQIVELSDEVIKETEGNEAIQIVEPVKEEYIYGENVNAPIEKIVKINQNSGTVCIVGEVFDIEVKELRNGKVLLIAAVTDYTSSISCKLFLNDMNKDKVLEEVTKGSYLKIKGDALYDNYQRELTMTISGIKKEEKQERKDTSDVKRVELHAHTQMSSMDAICSTKALIERAAKWGHPAIAITDHGVVQAFPEAMGAAKKHGIKVIYGVEGYLVEDEVPIIKDANDKPLSQSFVVFDIETTGFSSTNDKITEIGAIKIENYKVVDRFSELI